MPPEATFVFPHGFLWGTATSAYQVEGSSTNNNWYAWEQESGRIINGDRAGLACNWWGGRWKEDLDRAAETGQNAHRLSIEWSRIQPQPGCWDEAALETYRRILRGMYDRKLTPLVTLHHFTDPLWFAEMGGWEMDDSPGLFEKYVSKTVEALKEYTSLWLTINEPNVYVYGGYLGGGFPPGKNDLGSAFRVLTNLVRAHAAAYHAIHKIQKQARVGTCIHYRAFWPKRSWFPPDSIVANLVSGNFNDAFPAALQTGRLRFLTKSVQVKEAAGTQDYFGLNYYTGEQVEFAPAARTDFFHRRSFPEGALVSPTGFLANLPGGIGEALKWAKKFNLPVLITENGVEDDTDILRPRYIIEHLHKIWRNLNHDVQVKGYFYWTLVDNFEWERGWSQRFGLWGLGEGQQRIRRPSVDLYAEICTKNALDADMVRKYAPQVYDQIYPE